MKPFWNRNEAKNVSFFPDLIKVLDRKNKINCFIHATFFAILKLFE
jgi:hypothetical protein